MSTTEATLAQRLGFPVHVSVLRRKLLRYWHKSPGNSGSLEAWLIDLANVRGATVISRPAAEPHALLPTLQEVSNEELTIGILLPQNCDRPQILRLAAQLISRESVDFPTLRSLARQERVERILAALAVQALRVAPSHSLWRKIADAFRDAKPLRSPLLHYTRLAEPVPENGRVCRGRWALVV